MSEENCQKEMRLKWQQARQWVLDLPITKEEIPFGELMKEIGAELEKEEDKFLYFYKFGEALTFLMTGEMGSLQFPEIQAHYFSMMIGNLIDLGKKTFQETQELREVFKKVIKETFQLKRLPIQGVGW